MERYYNGTLTDSGITSVVSVGNVCPDDFQTTNTAPLNGVGNYPEDYELLCERVRLAKHPDMCPRFGNPIYPTSGVKRQEEVDYVDPRNLLSFRRFYDSDRGGFVHVFQKDFLIPVPGVTSSGDALYRSIYNYADNQWQLFPVNAPRLNVLGTTATLFDESGVQYAFDWNGTFGAPQRTFNKDRLGIDVGGGYWIRQSRDSRFIVLNADGSFAAIVHADGRKAQAHYSTEPMTGVAPGAGYLLSVTDDFARAIGFSYEPDGRLKELRLPDGSVISYDHEIAPATSIWPLARVRKPLQVTFPDGASKQYLWNESDYMTGSARIRDALTGIRDELGVRYATFRYRDGKAVQTEHARGVDAFGITDGRYAGSGAVSLVTPLGTTRSLNYAVVGGFSRLVGTSQPAGSGCVASSRAISYDANGNKASEDDFNGRRACFGNDLSRNLEVTRVEGLSANATCASYLGAGATLPSGVRKTSTEWHPDWRLETRVAEPGRLTTSIYNGQPDPFNGNAVASCAPASALLPDGKPIAVLCKRVEQASTDTDGHLGFSASLQPGAPNRTTTWTYNQYGQVLTENGPRTDVNDTTTYTYYSDTSFTGEGAAAQGHFTGDLQSVTNAAGKVTQYTQYNKHGQVLESVDPNGVVTNNTYDLRQRLLSTTVGGQTTTYQYDPVGQLKKVTLPDQSWIGYDYDDAHRQVAVYDNHGNRTDYTLDNAGNRTGETTKDPSGALKRQLSRSIDALGRVQQTTGRE
ncbi:MAG: RHS repeat protein [Planctomycetes bacterium]|nr:RHS repeat protein [Planctomycetota bacterium]